MKKVIMFVMLFAITIGATAQRKLKNENLIADAKAFAIKEHKIKKSHDLAIVEKIAETLQNNLHKKEHFFILIDDNTTLEVNKKLKHPVFAVIYENSKGVYNFNSRTFNPTYVGQISYMYEVIKKAQP